MPNHTKNIITGNKEAIKALSAFAKSKDSEFDFNKFIEMPKALKKVSTGGTFIDGKLVSNWITVNGKSVAIDEGEYIRLYGAYNWYNWAIANWDTKRNAYDVTIDEDTITFLTAWSPPASIFIKIAELFKDYEFKITWQEGEGSGSELLVSDGSIYEQQGWLTPEHKEIKIGDKEMRVCIYNESPLDDERQGTFYDEDWNEYKCVEDYVEHAEISEEESSELIEKVNKILK